jgi:tetratricopeptide (TPR) repeat protein
MYFTKFDTMMKTRVKTLLLTGLMMAAAFGRSLAQTPQQALVLMDAEQFSKAKTMLEGLVAASPVADNQYYLGYYHLRTGSLDQAKAAFEKGMAADPKSALNAVGLGAIKLANKDFAGGKAMIDKAIQDTKSKNADVLFRAAEAYTLFKETNDPAEAVRLVDLIMERTKKQAPEYQIVKGDAWLVKNEGGPAVSAYEQALLLDPKNAKALSKIAVVYKRGRNYPLAQDFFKKAIEADSNYAPVYQEYGDFFLLAFNYKTAARYFSKYIQKAEATPENVIKTAKLLFLSREYDSALGLIKQAKDQVKTDDVDIPRMEGYIQIEKGNYETGVSALETMIKKFPADKIKPSDRSYYGLGMSKIKGREEEGLKLLYEYAQADTMLNLYNYIYDAEYARKDYRKAGDAQSLAIAWKDRKFTANPKMTEVALKSTDYAKLAQSYYLVGAFARAARRNNPTMNQDSLKAICFNYGNKSDSAISKAIVMTPAWPQYIFQRARTSNVIDTSGVAWLAAPHYEKALEVSNGLAADARGKLDKNSQFEAFKFLAGFYSSPERKDDVKALDYAKKGLEIKADDKELMELVNGPALPPTTPPAVPSAPTGKAGGTPQPR